MIKLNSYQQTCLVLVLCLCTVIGSVFGTASAWFLPPVGEIFPALQRIKEKSISDDTQVNRRIVELVEDESATIAVVQKVAPSVVSIIIKKPRSAVRSNNIFNFFGFNAGQPATPKGAPDELIEVGGGSGFFASDDGYVVTNRHVVADDTARYFVITNDGQEREAQIVAKDVFLDVGVLKIEGMGFPVVTFGNSDDLQIGQTVIAIGNALAEFRNTVTKGVVSGLNRTIVAGTGSAGTEVIDDAIQTDAAINPGNSGGPLINLFGKVSGMNAAVSSQGASLGFAVPINSVVKIVESVKQYGRIVRPYLGVRYVTLTPEYAKANEIVLESGALIVSDGTKPAVVAGSPAEKAGLKLNDIITAVDGKTLTANFTLAKAIAKYNPDDEVTFKIQRDGAESESKVKLEELDAKKINN